MAKKKATSAPTLNDLYNEVAKRADTEGVAINFAETKRVLACFFDVLEDYLSATSAGWGGTGKNLQSDSCRAILSMTRRIRLVLRLPTETI